MIDGQKNIQISIPLFLLITEYFFELEKKGKLSPTEIMIISELDEKLKSLERRIEYEKRLKNGEID